MKILIIAYDVAPLELISSQRVNHFIEFFVRKGNQVDVLTSSKREIDGPILAHDKYNFLKKKANFIELPSTYRDVINRPLVSKYEKKYNKKSLKLRNFFKKVRSKLTKIFGQLLDYRTIWAYNAVKYLERHGKCDYDLILTSSLPANVVWVGHIAKKNNPNALWVADFRDLWSLNSLMNYNIFSRRLDTFLEKKFLKNSDLITTVSQYLKEQLETLHKKEILVIRNGIVLEEYRDLLPNSKRFKDNSKINIVYAGNIYKGKRDPTLLFQFINHHQLKDKVNIYFFGYYTENLAEIIKKEAADSYAFILDALPRKKIFEILRAADINLFLESGEVKDRGNISGKVFELIGIGRPILSIGPQETFESIQIIQEAGLFFTQEMLLEVQKDKNNKLYLGEKIFGVSDLSILKVTRDIQLDILYKKIIEKKSL